MKKQSIAAILIICLLFMFSACSSLPRGNDIIPTTDTSDEDGGSGEGQDGEGSELYFEYNGARVAIYDESAAALEVLGDPNSAFAADSCAYQGKDVFYYYDGFELTANELEGTERITSITLVDDMNSTPEGVKIGMSKEDAISLLSDAEVNGDVIKVYAGNSMLQVSTSNDSVVAIQYSYCGESAEN